MNKPTKLIKLLLVHSGYYEAAKRYIRRSNISGSYDAKATQRLEHSKL